MIGVFDSGIGGLTVVKKIFEILPEYQILYFGDTARTPYGGRGKEVIEKYAREAADFLIKKGAKIIVVACNTVSAVAYENLKKNFSLPIFEVVTPAVEKAVKITRNKRIGVIGTRATVNSRIYEKLIQEKNSALKVFSQAAPLLVPLVEEGWLKKAETKRIIKSYLHPLKMAQIDTLIMACTHYPLLRHQIQLKIGRQVRLVDPGEEVIFKLKEFLEKNSEIEKKIVKSHNHQFFVSDLTPKFREVAYHWLGQKIQLQRT
ncbi:MAG: glutamate racemase [Patescibacteria group bacterium]|nr:glutamate racemase [Patescibacteria group bacterium]